jgi:hypothetical protein
MYDFTNTGFQANVNQGSGSGSQVLDPVTGRWVDSYSAEGRNTWNNERTQVVDKAKTELAAQTNLATAEVDADAQNYEAEQNRAQGQQAFQYALSQAGGRRAPGGGIARGGAGRRGMSLNAATGGLAAANAAARRRTQGALAKARVAADPRNIELQNQIKVNSAANSARF